jgi:hypothetical protein
MHCLSLKSELSLKGTMRKQIVFNGKIFFVDPTNDKVISAFAEPKKGMFFTFIHPIRKNGKLIGGLKYAYNWLINGEVQIIPIEYINV